MALADTIAAIEAQMMAANNAYYVAMAQAEADYNTKLALIQNTLDTTMNTLMAQMDAASAASMGGLFPTEPPSVIPPIITVPQVPMPKVSL